MVKVKYIGDAPADALIGRVLPGEVREVKKEVAELLITGPFEIVKEVIKKVKKEE